MQEKKWYLTVAMMVAIGFIIVLWNPATPGEPSSNQPTTVEPESSEPQSIIRTKLRTQVPDFRTIPGEEVGDAPPILGTVHGFAIAPSGKIIPGMSRIDLTRIADESTEEDGTKLFSALTKNDGHYSILAPPGIYSISLRVGDVVRHGDRVEVFADKATTYNFYGGSGYTLTGAFQYEASPEFSTFFLEVSRVSDSKLVCSAMLAPVPEDTRHSKNNDDWSEGEDHLKPGSRHGEFYISHLPADLYYLRFSTPPQKAGEKSPFFWVYEVDLLNGDFDFGVKYADFTDFLHLLEPGPPPTE